MASSWRAAAWADRPRPVDEPVDERVDRLWVEGSPAACWAARWAAFLAGAGARLRETEDGFERPEPRPARPRVPMGMISASATGCSGGLGVGIGEQTGE